MLVKLLVLNIVILAALAADKVRYDNFALYKVHPKSEDEVVFLKDLHENDEALDFWVAPSRVGQYVSVVSPPEKREELEHKLSKRSIFSELMLPNIQEAFDMQLQSSRRRRDTKQLSWTSSSLSWTNYQTIEQINNWFQHLVNSYPDLVSLISAGTSFEGRNITGIKISRGNDNNKRVFFLGGGQQGADWLSPTVITYIADQLVKGDDPEALKASEEFEWHIIPLFNPDGFQYTQDKERLWMKNRRPTPSSTGIGVDLTKNWNSQWGVRGGSNNPLDNDYIGLGPFSEPETARISSYITSIASRLSGFLTFRSFGQKMVIPFAHTNNPMYNYNDMVTIGRRAAGSLAVKYNTAYEVGTSGVVHDGATGAIEDWVKYRFNPPIAATLYLRDQGFWGYTLPVNQITPVCQETFDAVMAILREARFINVL